MEENKILCTVEELKKKSKAAEMREKVKAKLDGVKEWVVNNPEYAVPLIMSIIPVGKKVVSGMHRNNTLKKEQELKDLYCYDRSLGHYWKLRRKLTSDEWQEVNRRKTHGEKLGDILQSMKVLK